MRFGGSQRAQLKNINECAGECAFRSFDCAPFLNDRPKTRLRSKSATCSDTSIDHHYLSLGCLGRLR